MLQRWQSVFLFLAALAVAVFAFVPAVGVVSDAGELAVAAVGRGGKTVGSLPLAVLDALVVVMSLVTIFKYRDLRLQHRLCKVNVLLIVALLATVAVLAFMQRGHAIAVVTPWVALPLVALFFTLWAAGRIKADRKLLSDSERIR